MFHFADLLIGKTNIARLYAQFLASVGAVTGTEFVEVTGSRLANEGVQGANKRIDQPLKAGGGAFFPDEAYQLANGNGPGGTAVLDLLLAEFENRVEQIVFILAGYDREM
jgi:ATPase family associated with various cellular activities (AAA)